ncbi:hypothetical protein [Methylobacterium aerolatum]|uniref:Uncharacterized protein n=1 Tax=Methylobacterium aerolatum TaxID=418708 RepID=A0ABU0HU31_9HYPH|nr:hypothetical protein [Methylobacterium aerolatum]MDQ0445836.1 hypothetical protein [Methylobacterium aerolatum]GJD35903.1 hypothetical protein FMGBMHLM_2816 [Methylobacterium aerolatum]
MSDASSPATAVSAASGGPSFAAALCGFLSSMAAGAALILLIGAL